MRILISGGIKSGKSQRALELAEAWPKPAWFLATASPFDNEMKERIQKHREERDKNWQTIEEEINIDRYLKNNMVLDCIPMWLNNLFYYKRESEWTGILERLIGNMPQDIIIVSNETGMGLVPMETLSRQYGVALGNANKMLAKAVDTVEIMFAGIPLRIK